MRVNKTKIFSCGTVCRYPEMSWKVIVHVMPKKKK